MTGLFVKGKLLVTIHLLKFDGDCLTIFIFNVTFTGISNNHTTGT